MIASAQVALIVAGSIPKPYPNAEWKPLVLNRLKPCLTGYETTCKVDTNGTFNPLVLGSSPSRPTSNRIC